MNFFKRKKKVNAFFEQFKSVVKTRGCVCYFQKATETRMNDVGIVEKFAIVPETNKLILLPGDPYDVVDENNLIAFEPLNRDRRRALQHLRMSKF